MHSRPLLSVCLATVSVNSSKLIVKPNLESLMVHSRPLLSVCLATVSVNGSKLIVKPNLESYGAQQTVIVCVSRYCIRQQFKIDCEA